MWIIFWIPKAITSSSSLTRTAFKSRLKIQITWLHGFKSHGDSHRTPTHYDVVLPETPLCLYLAIKRNTLWQTGTIRRNCKLTIWCGQKLLLMQASVARTKVRQWLIQGPHWTKNSIAYTHALFEICIKSISRSASGTSQEMHIF